VREKKEKPMPEDINELSDEEYFEQIVRPSREKTRAKLDHIAEVRAENFQKAKKKERRRKARRGLFEIYADEPRIPGWFDD